MTEAWLVAELLALTVLVPIGAFLIGSIPFGYLVGRFAYRTDLRQHGSGNIGAMNALRTLGTKGAIAVLLLDAAKGVVSVILAPHQFMVHARSTFAVAHTPNFSSIAGVAKPPLPLVMTLYSQSDIESRTPRIPKPAPDAEPKVSISQ